MRSVVMPPPELGPATDGPAVARPEPAGLSRPSSRLSAVGEISTATIAVTTTARDLIFFTANILILLHAASRPRLTNFAEQANNSLSIITLLFSKL